MNENVGLKKKYTINLVTEMMAPVFIASRIYFSVEMRGLPRILSCISQQIL